MKENGLEKKSYHNCRRNPISSWCRNERWLTNPSIEENFHEVIEVYDDSSDDEDPNLIVLDEDEDDEDSDDSEDDEG